MPPAIEVCWDDPRDRRHKQPQSEELGAVLVEKTIPTTTTTTTVDTVATARMVQSLSGICNRRMERLLAQKRAEERLELLQQEVLTCGLLEGTFDARTNKSRFNKASSLSSSSPPPYQPHQEQQVAAGVTMCSPFIELYDDANPILSTKTIQKEKEESKEESLAGAATATATTATAAYDPMSDLFQDLDQWTENLAPRCGGDFDDIDERKEDDHDGIDNNNKNHPNQKILDDYFGGRKQYQKQEQQRHGYYKKKTNHRGETATTSSSSSSRLDPDESDETKNGITSSIPARKNNRRSLQDLATGTTVAAAVADSSGTAITPPTTSVSNNSNGNGHGNSVSIHHHHHQRAVAQSLDRIRDRVGAKAMSSIEVIYDENHKNYNKNNNNNRRFRRRKNATMKTSSDKGKDATPNDASFDNEKDEGRRCSVPWNNSSN